VVHHAALRKLDESGATPRQNQRRDVMSVERINPDGMHKNPAFTQMIVLPASARTAIIGGQNAMNEKGEIVGKGDFAKQTAQALKNLVTCLEAVDASVEDLVQVKIYMKAGEDLRAGFGEWMKIWGERANPPLVTGLFVSGLANPDYLIEIEATAVIAG
jgi:enamine deaminase RidA (YjgF/YER057c/UK114 family)